MRYSFNDNWAVRRKVSFFQELAEARADWQPIRLPHDAMIHTERTPEASNQNGYFPGGRWEYRTTFTVPDEWRDRRVTLEFEGVYRGAMVYVNRDLAGRRPYGYSQFAVRLDACLAYGEENTVTVEMSAHNDSRWYSGAGIYRDVHLHVTESVHVALDGVTITTPELDPDGALVVVSTVVSNESAQTRTVRVRTQLLDAAGVIVASGSAPVSIRPGTDATSRQRLYVRDPQRWGVEHPYLYHCRTTLVDAPAGDRPIDHVVTTFGIRSLSLDPRHGLRVNGETVKLRGACVHHDNGVIGAATIARADERRVELLKQAGFNALRSAHQPMSRAMLDACDRVGMLVMDETFDMWTESKSGDDYAQRFEDWWEADVEAMVRKDTNHPCVVIYSVGNEIPELGSPLGAARGRELAEKIRSLDNTRFITNAVQPLLAVRDLLAQIRRDAGARRDQQIEESGVNTQMAEWHDSSGRLLRSPVVGERTEEAFAYTDVAGYNYLDTRYAIDHEQFPNRVVVGSETFPATISIAWPLVLASDHVIGDFTWTGWDYLGEAGIGRVEYATDQTETTPKGSLLGSFPWLTAHCGDLDITGHRRPVSYFREVVFGLRTEPFIAVQHPDHHGQQASQSGPWSWSDVVAAWTWNGYEGRPTTVEVYSPSDEVELLVDDVSLGRLPAGRENGYRAAFTAVYQPGQLTAIAYTDKRETGRTSLVSAVGEVMLAVTADRTQIRADDHDLAFVDISLVDAVGTLHHLGDRPVTVHLDGPAHLQGFGSADPVTLERFDATVRTTYRGRLLAVVRPTGAGRITVNVSADGCVPVAVTVDAVEVDA